MAAPTLTATPVSSVYSANTSPKTVTLNVVAGDLIVITGTTEDNTRNLSVPTATGETFTLRRAVEVASHSPVYIWTATAAATNSALVVSVASVGGADQWWGITGSVWRDHNGIGANNGANGTGQTTLSLTTTGTDSAIVSVVGDWNAVDASTRSWATINGNAATSQYYYRDASRYTTFGAHWINVGAAGAKAVTLSSPTTLKWSLAAFEVTGTSGNSPITATPTGIASSEAFGTSVVSATLTATPAGIASGETFGTTVLPITPPGVASAEVVANPVISATLTASPGGVATGEAFGSPVLSGALIVTPGGVGTAEAFGVPVIGGAAITLSPSGIDTGEGFGSPIITATLTATPNGIDTGEGFGVTSIAGAVTVTLTGIATGEALGSPTIASSASVTPGGIGSGEAFGSPIVSAQLTVTFSGIPTAAEFGTLLALWGRTLSPSAIGSGEAFGSVFIGSRINGIFRSTLEGFLTGEIDWDTAVIKVALVRSYSFDPAHKFVSDVTAAGGILHAVSPALSATTVLGGTVDAADVTITANSSPSTHFLLVFQSSAVTGGVDVAATAQRVIAWISEGMSPIIPDGSPVTIAWDNGPYKIFTLTSLSNSSPITLSPAGIATVEAFGSASASYPSDPGAVPGWERTAANTGLAGAGVTGAMLTDYTGPWTIPANTILTRRRLNVGANQLVLLSNVELIECEINTTRIGSEGSIRGGLWNEPYTSGQRMVSCDINGPNSTAGESMGFYTGAGDRIEIISCNINGMTIGVWLDAQSDQTGACVIDRCYIKTYTVGGAHKDGITRRNGASKLTITNNRIDCSGEAVTGAIFVQDTWGGNNIGNLDMSRNYFEGGGYNVGTPSVVQAPLTCSNNRFRSTEWGPVSSGSYVWPVWADNHVYDVNGVDRKGALIPAP